MKNLTLEVSLKPFFGLDQEATKLKCKFALNQWKPLVDKCAQISVLFWAADGSEILEYNGNLDDEMEWARFLGNGNAHIHPTIPSDPENKSLHARSYPYRPNTSRITYRRFAEIANCWREAITSIGKTARLGMTFDPGGEFAPSSFKYERHREICLADTMGAASFVCCYGRLHGDSRPYAGFPDGIPENTSLGTFLGRQFTHIAKDLGFDSLWLSNGFGFGMETWRTGGPLFDGEKFSPEQAPETRDRILQFWKDFREECPEFELETRGTNLGTGTDLASDATPLREIYEGEFNCAPPPNSPWAAINGDFGIELAGYMSRIAELPSQKSILFRYYLHDPWWLNSPWLDRYEEQPHDIYLPTSISRINDQGNLDVPENLNLLTIDNSYGEMPNQVPIGATPHLIRSWDERPDAAGPLVWLYPFDQLHDAMFQEPRRPERLFHNDWFVREAINAGLPVNTVISTRTFHTDNDPIKNLLKGRILLSPTPYDERTESSLIDWVENGEKAILYGPLDQSPRLRDRLGLETASELNGPMNLESRPTRIDTPTHENEPLEFEHRSIMSGGALSETPGKKAKKESTLVTQNNQRRAITATWETPNGGQISWTRGPLPLTMTNKGEGHSNHLPVQDPPGTSYDFGSLNRALFADLGWTISFDRRSILQRTPVLSIHRNRNAWLFSGFTPDTTVGLRLRTPYGAPLLLGMETWLDDNKSFYHTQRGWRYECRLFVEQSGSSLISHKEELPGQVGVTRRLWAYGLKGATLRFFPPSQSEKITLWHNPDWPYISGKKVPYKTVETQQGEMIETTEPVDGTVLISW